MILSFLALILIISLRSKKRKSCHSGFSLMELSVSLVVIAVLVSGVLTARTLLSQSRLKTAIRLSKSAPILDIFNEKNTLAALVWFDATDASSITLSSNIVSKWHSKISDVIATQSTSANQPTYSSTGLNGFPAIYFDGTNDYLSMKAVLAAGDDTFTIAAVWQASANQNQTLWSQEAATTTQGGRRASLRMITALEYGFNGSGIGDESLSPTISLNIPVISVLIVNSSDSTSTNANSEVLYHSLTTSSNTSVTNLYMLNIGDYIATIGAIQANSTLSDYFKGYISEIIVFDKALSSDEASSVANYFMNKYRIVR